MQGLVVEKTESGKVVELKHNLVEPTAIEGEVVVKIHAASVNPFDQEVVDGRFDQYFAEYQVSREVLAGLEFSGTVVKGGTKFKNGDKVFGYVDMITGWKTHAELIAINENYIAKMPDNLDFHQAAALPLGALTTLTAMELGHLEQGNHLLINGASGGLGVYAVQIGKALGATVHAVSGQGHEDFLKSLGADIVYDYNHTDILSLTQNFDLILDLTNRKTLEDVAHLLTEKGVFIPAEPNEQNGGTSESQRVAYLMVTHGDSQKLSRIADWVANGIVKPVIDKLYSFEQHKLAYQRTQAKGKRGRIVMHW